jgi:lysine-N-methylase
MKITKPYYYDSFRCIASACPDSCCHEWSVSVDPTTAACYRALPGPLGDALRQVLAEEDGDTVMTIRDGRCPMWRADGLCRIQAELGHDALCKTCREFPRLTHDYGNFQEWGLELSCPEAARLIFFSPARPAVVTEISGGAEPEYDEEAMALLLRTRPIALSLLEQERPMGEILAQLLMYGYHVQAELDGDEPKPFDPESALAEARSIAGQGDPKAILSFYQDLEILTDRWHRRLDAPAYGHWDGPYPALARYFVERYWLQAVSDYDLVCRVKFAVISCLAINILGGDLLTTAQLYSKEIENDPENVEALLDAAYTGHAFTDDKLLGLLLR